MKRISSCLAATVLVAIAVSSASARASALPKVHRFAVSSGARRMAVTPAVSQALGVGINLDVVGRLTGSGNTLFRTSVDIANNTNTATQVDAFFDGAIGGVNTDIVVSVTAAGLVAQGAPGQLLADHAVFHSDDYIDDLKAAGLITQAEEDAGILGSLFVIYNSPSTGLFDQIGQGSVQARFYSSNFGGTIGVSANGHELTASEPTSLVGIARDTTGEANTPQVTTNFFINNEGFADAGTGNLIVNPVTVRMSGFSNVTGNPLPHTQTITIDSYETVGLGNIYATLGASTAGDGDSIVVFFDIISGNSAISGLSSTNDSATKDPSAAQLRPADWTAGR
jgi:hypothetical protein